MNIYVQILTIYGITFLVSMFVALIIWALAKLIDVLPEGSFSLKTLIANIQQNIISSKIERKAFLKELRETKVKRSEALLNYHHEHA